MLKIDAAVYAASQTGGTAGLTAVAHDGTLAGDVPDVSSLTARIAGLESRMSAPTTAVTPGVTTLTATQLGSPYLDDYNIIRARKPTGNTESEEPHHE